MKMTVTSNVALEWVGLLLRVQKVPGSNIGSKTGHLEVYLGFPQYLQALDQDRFLPCYLQFIIHLSSLHPPSWTPLRFGGGGGMRES
jgi:hypothetical protein